MESINTVKIDIGDEEEEDELLNGCHRSWWSMRNRPPLPCCSAGSASVITVRDVWWISWNRGGIIGPSEGSKPPQGSCFQRGILRRTDRKGGRRRGYSLKISRFPTRSRRRAGDIMKIFFNTLGCSKNAVDSENAAALLRRTVTSSWILLKKPERSS